MLVESDWSLLKSGPIIPESVRVVPESGWALFESKIFVDTSENAHKPGPDLLESGQIRPESGPWLRILEFIEYAIHIFLNSS